MTQPRVQLMCRWIHVSHGTRIRCRELAIPGDDLCAEHLIAIQDPAADDKDGPR